MFCTRQLSACTCFLPSERVETPPTVGICYDTIEVRIAFDMQSRTLVASQRRRIVFLLGLIMAVVKLIVLMHAKVGMQIYIQTRNAEWLT